MNIYSILQSAEIAGSDSDLGTGKSIQNRHELNKQLRFYRKMVAIAIIVLFLIALGIIVTIVVVAMTTPEELGKDLRPYLGSGALLALLEFERRLIEQYMLAVLSLSVAEHSDEDGFATYIEIVLQTKLNGRAKRRKNLTVT